MISKEANEALTRVGPGTPMGNLLRRYWHPVAASAELPKGTKKVRILGEDLVVYRDTSGNVGLVDWQCPHRKASMEYGIPEENGLRCPYHGWLFKEDGACLEQPAEPAESTFKNRICIKSYPVQEKAGLIFAYMGPSPAPLLPNYDLFVEEKAVRSIGTAVLPCNWLQIMENSVDPTHAEWLHGVYMAYVQNEMGQHLDKKGFLRHHVKIGFDVFDYGIIKRRMLDGGTEEDEDWKVGHPLVFPNMLKVGSGGRYSFQIRVPIDDTHTMYYWYLCLKPREDIDIEIPVQETIPHYTVPFMNEDGKFKVNFVDGQDIMCWVTQGPIADRSVEALGTSDKGIILYRQLLQQEMAKVAKGEGDPLAIVRDPDINVKINLPMEEKKGHAAGGSFKRWRAAYAPEILEFMGKYEKALEEKNLYGDKSNYGL